MCTFTSSSVIPVPVSSCFTTISVAAHLPIGMSTGSLPESGTVTSFEHMHFMSNFCWIGMLFPIVMPVCRNDHADLAGGSSGADSYASSLGSAVGGAGCGSTRAGAGAGSCAASAATARARPTNVACIFLAVALPKSVLRGKRPTMADPAAAVLAALHARNRAGAAALRATRSLVEAETRASELQRTLDKQQRGTTLLVKTKHDMEADLELLKANEANQGVSREHIQMLQEQLAGAKTEASIAADEAQKARATEKLTEDGARALAEKVAARELELAEAREEAAELRRAAERVGEAGRFAKGE